ncbi:MAG: CbiX/SirB N-terminal domain-containing protein [Pseudomonadota bacterium]
MTHAIIVSHGQPSDPEPAEAEIAALAARVQAVMPGWQVASATLAMPGALAAQLAQAGPGGLIYPLFMAGGWFTKQNLPARLAQAGAVDWSVLEPFGLDDAVQALTVTLAVEAAAGRIAETPVLLAAHGSFRSTAPSEVAYAVANRVRQAGFARVKAAFIDQEPRIADVAADFGPDAVVLPFFAARGGHVIDDLPQALAAAGSGARLLNPVGCDPRVPALIAAALQRGADQAAAAKEVASD